MTSRKLAVTGAVAACVACCAPLVAPLVWPVLVAAGIGGTGAVGGGWLAGRSVEAVIFGGLALAAIAGAAGWLRQRRKRSAAMRLVLVQGPSCDLQTCGPKPGPTVT